jgi:Fe-S-cluster containining protein
MYSCAKCPGYCCSYPIIEVNNRDIKRLARHFDLTFEQAEKKFTVARYGVAHTMRRKADKYFGKICRFFDTEKRCCTIYEARPQICRSYPGGRCGYYDFLTSERRSQRDPEHVAMTDNN